MKISELVLEVEKNDKIKVELPNTDELRYLRNFDDLVDFVADYGSVLVEYDEEFKVYRVPEFKEGRERYSEAKTRWCNQYGSN